MTSRTNKDTYALFDALGFTCSLIGFLNMPELMLVLKRGAINKRVSRVARKISSDYQNGELILIGVLKGAFIFLSDLVRDIKIPVQIDFIETSSYGDGTCSSGNIHLTKAIETDIHNKDVLLVEDIIDTGLTLDFLIEYLKSFGPKTVKVCTLIDKRERREVNIKIDYACHVIDSGFLVGYGLDHAGAYRQLPEVYELKL